jgi:hypothetical protein
VYARNVKYIQLGQGKAIKYRDSLYMYIVVHVCVCMHPSHNQASIASTSRGTRSIDPVTNFTTRGFNNAVLFLSRYIDGLTGLGICSLDRSHTIEATHMHTSIQ